MNVLNDVYNKSVTENEKNVRFWEDYLNNLKSLDFSKFVDKLRVPILVPIGSKILFRGELKHTNEVTVSLGADYFVKCSLKQAEVLRQHRIKDAQSKLDSYNQGKEYLENQISFSKQILFEKEANEIIEVYNDQEDNTWRESHRDNVKLYKQRKRTEENLKKEISDEELWNRLEELELKEELENELLEFNDNKDYVDSEKEDSFDVKEEIKEKIDRLKQGTLIEKKDNAFTRSKEEKTEVNEIEEKRVIFTEANEILLPTLKVDLLQQVLDKQNELENKLLELKNRERSQSQTESDLISIIDEMEQLDEVENEIDRLDDILQSEDMEEIEEENPVSSGATKIKRSVSFVDEVDTETLELTFTHSEVEPDKKPYNQVKGVLKPSDIYEAYSNLFDSETISILKKSKFRCNDATEVVEAKNVIEDSNINRTIVVKDVVEKVVENDKLENESRPTSLFKQRRMQSKS